MQLKLENLPKSVELVEDDGEVFFRYIDERELPYELVIRQSSDWRQVVDAIRTLAVRGAPAIGLAGSSALALWAAKSHSPEEIGDVADSIATARPTAVNLKWAVDRALDHIKETDPTSWREALFHLVQKMQDEDERTNRAIGRYGAELLSAGANVLTHCNAGSLATYFYGTALGIVYAAAGQGKVNRVFADETRPVGQGARLTAWELSQAGIPVTLICDNMAASLMAARKVDAVIVGADRIARNGDAANKIGTYGLAVLAKEHGVPFYVAAPMSTVDPALSDGSGIVIEERPTSEVLSRPIPGVDVWNPAFDVTPARYISRIVTEKGAITPHKLASQL